MHGTTGMGVFSTVAYSLIAFWNAAYRSPKASQRQPRLEIVAAIFFLLCGLGIIWLNGRAYHDIAIAVALVTLMLIANRVWLDRHDARA